GLKTPLESLELAFCCLERSDLYGLSDSVHASSLKKLDLSGNNLSEKLLQPFLQLLSAASPSLLHLDIMECKLNDSVLTKVLPALCRCSRLCYLGLFCNPLSCQGLKTLLQGCLRLRDLRLVVYPYPVDCYDENLNWMLTAPSWLDCAMDQEKLTRFAAELQEMLVSAQRADVKWTTDMSLHRSLYYFSL
ncbi:leucine-rich repeat-containing protein 14-like, partial [Gastrophryne carolinensis]